MIDIILSTPQPLPQTPPSQVPYDPSWGDGGLDDWDSDLEEGEDDNGTRH